MRTTVTLDADVEALLRRAMHEREASFKEVLNAAIRTGLTRQAMPAAEPFRQRVYELGEPQVDLSKANALAGELEDLDILLRMGQQPSVPE
ncbi:MAG: antitoxin [Pseudomonadota bacterium]|nr:antitoxin [Pseudomonadota bacterium]